jgi:hypothetical protein
MRAEKLKHYIVVSILGLALATILSAVIFPPRLPIVEAQSGTGAPFTLTFTFPASGSNTIIPGCTASIVTGCIPNRNQIAHSVSVKMAASVSCGIDIDASSDNVNFQTIGANGEGGIVPSGTLLTFTAQANGYFPHIRLKLLPCSTATTITYTGYSVPLQIVYGTTSIFSPVLTFPIGTGFGGPTPTVLQSFQVSNPNESTAYFWVVADGTTRTDLTEKKLFEMAIAPGDTVYYNGPPICLLCTNQSTTQNYLYFQATTTLNGGTPVAVPLTLTFQANISGPYYPWNPISQ